MPFVHTWITAWMVNTMMSQQKGCRFGQKFKYSYALGTSQNQLSQPKALSLFPLLHSILSAIMVAQSLVQWLTVTGLLGVYATILLLYPCYWLCTSKLWVHFVVQLWLIFHLHGIDTFLAYVQWFVTTTIIDPGSGMQTLKCVLKRDGSCIGDVITLSQIHSPAHIIPCFGKVINHHLNSNTSYELSSKFWPNKYWNK